MTDAASAFIDELLHPARLARDVERGLLGDILGRLDWPTRRYPMLAAWTEQWSRPAEEPQNSVPLVHARHPAPISTTTIHHVDVHPVTMRRAADPRPAPPLVQAKRPATPTPTAAPGASRPPASPATSPAPPATSTASPAPSPVAPAPPTQREPTRPAHTREPSRTVSLPRVVSAFRPDLSVRPAEPAHAPTLPHGREPAHTPHAPIAAPSSAPPTITREPAASSVTPTSSGTPTANPIVTAHRPADLADSPLVHAAPLAPHESSTAQQSHSDPAPQRPQPAPADLPRVAATMEPAARPDVPLVHIDPTASPSATPASSPHASLTPQLSPAHHTSTSSTTTRPVTTPRVAETTTPRVDPQDSPLPHPTPPAAPRPVVAPQSAPVTRARATRPATIAARWVADDEAPPLHRPPAARPQRVELSHATSASAPASPTVARRPVPEASPSPTTARSSSAPTTTTTPQLPSSPSPSPPSPSLDVDAVVDTTLRRLGRELERARGRRRAFR